LRHEFHVQKGPTVTMGTNVHKEFLFRPKESS